MFAEGLREHLPSPAPAGALLPCRLPRGRPPVEEMEDAATLPQISERQREAAGTMPPQSGETQGHRISTKNRLCGSCEGHPHRIFFLRPPGVLSAVQAHQAVAPAEVLFPGLPPCSGAGSETRAALAERFAQEEIPEPRGLVLRQWKLADIFSAY